MDRLEILQWIDKALREAGERPIAGFGLAIAFEDGGVGATFGGELDRLLGAAARLEHRISLELDKIDGANG